MFAPSVAKPGTYNSMARLRLGHNQNAGLQNILLMHLHLPPQMNAAQMWKVERHNSKFNE